MRQLNYKYELKHQAKYRKKIEAAVAEATKALRLPIRERIFKSMGFGCIDAVLNDIGSKSPLTLYNRYIARRQCRKSPSKSPKTPFQLSVNLDNMKPELYQLLNEMPKKLLERGQTQSLLTGSLNNTFALVDTQKRLISEAARQFHNLASSLDTKKKLRRPRNLRRQLKQKSAGKINTHTEDFEHRGTWIECVKCKKWRFIADVHDPSEVSQDWHCGLQPKWKTTSIAFVNTSINPCDEEEDDACKGEADTQPYVYSEFTAGSIVWAKMRGTSNPFLLQKVE
ncbi:hypothetical protein ACTXT7_005620 [Hymenolepis weldensis]